MDAEFESDLPLSTDDWHHASILVKLQMRGLKLKKRVYCQIQATGLFELFSTSISSVERIGMLKSALGLLIARRAINEITNVILKRGTSQRIYTA
jgi:lambda repressor-like predicted transcriptional regulator